MRLEMAGRDSELGSGGGRVQARLNVLWRFRHNLLISRPFCASSPPPAAPAEAQHTRAPGLTAHRPGADAPARSAIVARDNGYALAIAPACARF